VRDSAAVKDIRPGPMGPGRRDLDVTQPERERCTQTIASASGPVKGARVAKRWNRPDGSALLLERVGSGAQRLVFLGREGQRLAFVVIESSEIPGLVRALKGARYEVPPATPIVERRRAR